LRPGLPFYRTTATLSKADVGEKEIRLSTTQTHREEPRVPPDNDTAYRYVRESGSKESVNCRYFGHFFEVLLITSLPLLKPLWSLKVHACGTIARNQSAKTMLYYQMQRDRFSTLTNRLLPFRCLPPPSLVASSRCRPSFETMLYYQMQRDRLSTLTNRLLPFRCLPPPSLVASSRCRPSFEISPRWSLHELLLSAPHVFSACRRKT
jgi:hypothetical protein